MIQIERTYDPAKGLLQIEDLSGYVFSAEAFAHTFYITRADGDEWPGRIYCHFVRADGVNVYCDGTADGATASLTLDPKCYKAPGRFLLVIFHEEGSLAHAIYAGRASVIGSDGDTTVAADGVLDNIEAQIEEILANLDGTVSQANLVAIFARNVGDIEGEIQTFQSSVDGLNNEFDNVKNALAAQDFRVLNTPNLLNKDAWWVDTGNNSRVVCGDGARWSKSGGAYMKSINHYTIYYTEPTAEQTAGASYVWHREAYTDENTGKSYQEAWFVYNDNQDGITTSYVNLTGDSIITDQDEEVYDKAIQYNITENTAWGNMETLYYPQGMSTQHYKQGETPKSHGYYVDEMQVGEKYTVSCWARLISGSEAWLKFGWGGNHTNGMSYPAGQVGSSDIYKITNTEWKRISWTFVFNPTGAEYSESVAEFTDNLGNTYNRVTRTYNWEKRIMIGVHRKYTAVLQLCGFRLVRGGLYGDNTVDTLAMDVQAAQAQAESVLSSIAPVESGNTASRNYAAGALVVWNGGLYKATAAITTGQTLSTSNLAATTLAAELDSIRNA